MALDSAADADPDFRFTGPGTLAGRYLRRFWQPVYVARELPRGQVVPIRIMSEDFTLYRGESGAVHVVSFRCGHRGTQLSTGWVEGDTIRCSYHGWRYEESGQCIEQPAEAKPFCQKVKLKSYPVEEQLGFIFVYFGEDPPPPFPRWPEFDCGPIESETREPTVAMLPCNYFQSSENIMDDVHVNFAHRDMHLHKNVRRTIPRITAQETRFGLTQFLHHPGRVDKIHFIMPNQCYLAYPARHASPRLGLDQGKLESGSVQTFRILFFYVPIDDVSHLHFECLAFPQRKLLPEQLSKPLEQTPPHEEIAAVLAGKKRVSDLLSHPQRVRIQDGVSICGQGVLADRTQDRLGSSDAAVILLRKLWMRELRLLSCEKPLTPFDRPDPAALRQEELDDPRLQTPA